MAHERDFIDMYKQIEISDRFTSESQRLTHYFELEWEYDQYRNPEDASSMGYYKNNNRWSDLSAAAIRQELSERRQALETLQAIISGQLTKRELFACKLYQHKLENEIIKLQLPSEFMPITPMGGIQRFAPSVINRMPRETERDFQRILTRLAALPKIIEQSIERMEIGLRNGITPPKILMSAVPGQIDELLTEESENSPLLEAFTSIDSNISKETQHSLRVKAASLYANDLAPSLRNLKAYIENDYIPQCRESIGYLGLPEGKAHYADWVKIFTTTDLSPDEIFDTGLKEVDRIKKEMYTVIESTGFDGDFKDFVHFLRTDEQFYCSTEDELIDRYTTIARKAESKLPELFGKLPRLPFEIKVIPDYQARHQTTAYYQPGSVLSNRPGYYYINTYNLAARPIYEMEALSIHEAVPGHHLQIALAQELDDLPHVVKHTWYTAFGEGWALYSERLGEDMGFYKDPYSRFGQLTYEMWRAIRLVVDVGMHYKGWSRQQAIDYFLDNSAKTEHDVKNEIDRYLLWPGQALAYKIGELTIMDIRHKAEQTLGGRFDLKAFHDELLSDGGMPLDMLNEKMERWLNERLEQ